MLIERCLLSTIIFSRFSWFNSSSTLHHWLVRLSQTNQLSALVFSHIVLICLWHQSLTRYWNNLKLAQLHTTRPTLHSQPGNSTKLSGCKHVKWKNRNSKIFYVKIEKICKMKTCLQKFPVENKIQLQSEQNWSPRNLLISFKNRIIIIFLIYNIWFCTIEIQVKEIIKTYFSIITITISGNRNLHQHLKRIYWLDITFNGIFLSDYIFRGSIKTWISSALSSVWRK